MYKEADKTVSESGMRDLRPGSFLFLSRHIKQQRVSFETQSWSANKFAVPFPDNHCIHAYKSRSKSVQSPAAFFHWVKKGREKQNDDRRSEIKTGKSELR